MLRVRFILVCARPVRLVEMPWPDGCLPFTKTVLDFDVGIVVDRRFTSTNAHSEQSQRRQGRHNINNIRKQILCACWAKEFCGGSNCILFVFMCWQLAGCELRILMVSLPLVVCWRKLCGKGCAGERSLQGEHHHRICRCGVARHGMTRIWRWCADEDMKRSCWLPWKLDDPTNCCRVGCGAYFRVQLLCCKKRMYDSHQSVMEGNMCHVEHRKWFLVQLVWVYAGIKCFKTLRVTI